MTDNTTPHPAAVFRQALPQGQNQPQKGIQEVIA